MSSWIIPGNVHFNYAQLEGIWVLNHGNPQYAPMAAAIATAESGGNCGATNSGGDVGLWQINRPQHGPTLATFDINGNARAAIALSNNGTNWRPWCTAYSDAACGSKGGTYLGSGSPYQQYLQGGVAPDTSVPTNGTQAAANTASLTSAGTNSATEAGFIPNPFGIFGGLFSGPVDALANDIAKGLISGVLAVLNPIITVFVGVIGMVAGGVMVLFGLFLLVGQTQAGQTAGKAAMGAASIAFPELIGADIYESAAGRTVVTRRRRPVVGGMRVTTRRYPSGGPNPRRTERTPFWGGGNPVQQDLDDQAGGYTRPPPQYPSATPQGPGRRQQAIPARSRRVG